MQHNKLPCGDFISSYLSFILLEPDMVLSLAGFRLYLPRQPLRCWHEILFFFFFAFFLILLSTVHAYSPLIAFCPLAL